MKITGNAQTREVVVGEIRLDPAPSQRIVNHSPDGFSWGYHGSGCAQLALAILLFRFTDANGKVAEHGREFATRYYQDFKRDVIATLPMDEDFEIDTEDVEAWIAARGRT